MLKIVNQISANTYKALSKPDFRPTDFFGVFLPKRFSEPTDFFGDKKGQPAFSSELAQRLPTATVLGLLDG